MSSISLREADQSPAIESLRQNFRAGIVRQILCAPTGAGKTVMGAYLLQECLRNLRRAIFVCDRVTLVNQTSAALDKWGIEHGVIQAGHWRSRGYEKIQVCSAQTLAKRGWPECDLAIVDECHTQYKSTTRYLMDSGVRTVGLTATPFTTGLGKTYQAVVQASTTNQLIGSGDLSDYQIYTPSRPDMEGAAQNGMGEWTATACSERMAPVTGDIVEWYLKLSKGRKFICFGSDVADCDSIRDKFLAAGILAESCTYRTPDKIAAGMIEEFGKPDSSIRGLISVAKLAKGFDVPDVGCVIMARPLRRSLSEHIQSLGRGLRASPLTSKDGCNIHDHTGNCERFWHEMMDYFEVGAGRLCDGTKEDPNAPEKKKKEPTTCPLCRRTHDRAPYCPFCGFEYRAPSKDKAPAPGELVKVDKKKGLDPERVDFYAQLLGYAREHNYNPGWAAHRYKLMYRAWPPRGMRPMPKKPEPKMANWILYTNIRQAKARKRRR